MRFVLDVFYLYDNSSYTFPYEGMEKLTLIQGLGAYLIEHFMDNPLSGIDAY